MAKQRIKLVPLVDAEQFQNFLFEDNDSVTLREFLCQCPALSTAPIDDSIMELKLGQLSIAIAQEPPDCPLYRPPGLVIAGGLATNDKQSTNQSTNPTSTATVPAPINSQTQSETKPDTLTTPSDDDFPADISEKDAVKLAYAEQIDSVASFLRTGLSVLVVCEKLVVAHLWQEMARRANLNPIELTVPDEEEGGLMPRSLRQRQLATLKNLINSLKQGDILVIPHLDLLAGGSDTNLPTESRELIELVYKQSDRLILAFVDRSQDIPEVLAARFAVRLLISGVSRTVTYPNGEEKNIGRALVTAEEASHFQDFDPEGLYKNIAGMNPIRLRHAIKYAVQEVAGTEQVPVTRLYQAIRAFKAQTSANFEVPDVSFNDIGGYREVKAELSKALNLMTGSYDLPNEKLRGELIPRGFIFHGPPGTGKTLFAKAIANQLNATIQVVSGPEVTDMYVGESERKVRELFAEARRNAPAVLVFDEFDSIATKRSGRDDGGSRAGNALVAQILTEMDGFRPDVPMLVIGTTNRLDIIDEALLRPSRFKAVTINRPDIQARRAIAQVHAKHFSLDNISPELIEIIATETEGMSGDDIRSLFRDACVGLHCESPPRVPDALRFGELVGLLRKAAIDRNASVAERRTSALDGFRSGERVRPTVAMISLTPQDNL
ncbi:ATP-binding protein [Calothrix sp. PCC 6303]|uniref:ATP-binding protein n=1 Tax=Calothrix sp. PCC 6303 TaxID=1170562 RepID=UPI0002A03A66|nr:ATP-binding protein [Calothrix sp. PCC 6303]AFZ01315.1 Vesicle-fusing ATPase [Calothrix sp. PCC 6303]